MEVIDLSLSVCLSLSRVVGICPQWDSRTYVPMYSGMEYFRVTGVTCCTKGGRGGEGEDEIVLRF